MVGLLPGSIVPAVVNQDAAVVRLHVQVTQRIVGHLDTKRVGISGRNYVAPRQCGAPHQGQVDETVEVVA